VTTTGFGRAARIRWVRNQTVVVYNDQLDDFTAGSDRQVD
jgi:hypothetical protein